jgi:hypothetical protein
MVRQRLSEVSSHCTEWLQSAMCYAFGVFCESNFCIELLC